MIRAVAKLPWSLLRGLPHELCKVAQLLAKSVAALSFYSGILHLKATWAAVKLGGCTYHRFVYKATCQERVRWSSVQLGLVLLRDGSTHTYAFASHVCKSKSLSGSGLMVV